jgi:hypothetical protein
VYCCRTEKGEKNKTQKKHQPNNAKKECPGGVSVGLWLHFEFKKGKVNRESK